MLSAKVEGLERTRKKMLALVGAEGASLIQDANQKSANEFEALVRTAIPVGDETLGHLRDTLTQRKFGPTAVSVSIGVPGGLDYPLHLEVGHKARDGSHVPGKAFWFPAKQIVKKRAHGRAMRAGRAAIRKATGL